MPNHKHLTLDDRNFIHTGLNTGLSFRQIARHLDKDPSTISKEIRHYRMPISTGAVGRAVNNCIHRYSCTVNGLCDQPVCNRNLCRYCKKCNKMCSLFQGELCLMLSKPPYVCNGCKLLNKCVLSKYFYRAIPANNSYQNNLVSCRTGISFTEDELVYMDTVIAPLVKKKYMCRPSI